VYGPFMSAHTADHIILAAAMLQSMPSDAASARGAMPATSRCSG
jgi:hypothetical protein